VALHTDLSGRNGGKRASLYGKMAEPAVQSEIPRVKFVTKFDGLNRTITDRQIRVGSVIGKRRSAKQREH